MKSELIETTEQEVIANCDNLSKLKFSPANPLMAPSETPKKKIGFTNKSKITAGNRK